ncbi:MAG: NADH-quinone oxidoreductase subunit H [Methanospirillum sp.]|uniref:complex I subunit 1 family protein n=1 Tax=Methanospirillum sp. TaxID=45200 RepID=UPI00236D6D42|nr:complex I subunit 1 family protein [Methanospirillum sp.]MDD1730174.1 NADH-quinone oxidoreductase subunit H [Methanospirillum sp.]
MNTILAAVAFLIVAPVIGGLISGVDRIITARMQGRVGPPVLQPFLDIAKLFEKEKVGVWQAPVVLIFLHLAFMVVTGLIFFGGGDLLLAIFALTLSEVFLILAAYSTRSPYAHVGAGRELIQLMAVEPVIIITAVGFYMVTGSFAASDIFSFAGLPILLLPGVFLSMVCILTFKLRKSPFDLSSSHHAHQELVKGVMTEFSGSTLGMVEIAHLYELVILLGLMYLFFAGNLLLGLVAVVIVYLLEILADNSTSRVRWLPALRAAWVITLVLGGGNIIILSML